MIFIVVISTCAYFDGFIHYNSCEFSTYIIISKISFANALMTPPKKVRNPFALCDASCDLSDRPICTTPKPSRISPIALIAEKIKSERLFIVPSGSAAKTVPVSAVIITASAISTSLALRRIFCAFAIL